MLHPNRSLTAKQQISQIVFDLKAAPASLISELTGVSIDTVYETLKGSEFESVKIPISHPNFGRASVRLHNLTLLGEKYLGRFRNPELVHAARAMSYSRLPTTWDLLSHFRKTNELYWSLSPWRPCQKAPWFDGLICLKASDDMARVMGFVNLSNLGDPALYYDYINAWIELLKSNLSMRQAPTHLVILAPGMNRTIYNYLSKSFEKPPVDIVFWTKGGYDSYFCNQLPLFKRRRNHSPNQPVFQTFLDKDRFDHEFRYSPYPKSLIDKNTVNTPSFFTSKALPALSQPAIGILRCVGEYPTLTVSEYREIFPWSEKGKKELRSRIRDLEEEGYLQKIEGRAEGFALTEQGVLLLAGNYGIGTDETRRLLGRPDEIKRFKRERRHLASSKQVVIYLLSELNVSHWEFLNSRIKFEEISFPFGRKVAKKIIVEPDSILYFNDTGSDNAEPIWIEIDRGTRQGEKRVKAQLEKYFLIMMAKIQPKAIAPIFYVVDADENSETRLAYIARLLEQLGKRYLQFIPPQVFILVTMEELVSDTYTPLGERKFRTILAGDEMKWMAFGNSWEAWIKRAQGYRGRMGGCCDRSLLELFSQTSPEVREQK